jgi:hypothetical protein
MSGTTFGHRRDIVPHIGAHLSPLSGRGLLTYWQDKRIYVAQEMLREGVRLFPREKPVMRKSLLNLAILAAFAAPAIAIAQTAAPAPAPSPVTGNMTIASDYRFRGISQTYKGPAI